MDKISIEVTADSSQAIKELKELEVAAKRAGNAFEKVIFNKWKAATYTLIGIIIGLIVGVTL